VRTLRRTAGTTALKQAVPLSRYFLFFALAIGGCAVDLASKSWMFAHLGMPDPNVPPWWIWDGVFGFQTSLNEGALFGMGQGYSLVFAALSIAAALGILGWLFGVGAARDRFLTVTLAIFTIGILGNLYDRLGLPNLVWNDAYGNHLVGQRVYAVRDFIVMFQIGQWHWPNYNLADSSMVCGAALLMVHALFVRPELETKS
jgi:signal peptidase II